MLGLLQVAVASFALASGLYHESEGDLRTFQVLVAPSEGAVSNVVPSTTGIVAKLGHQPYTVRLAEPLRAGQGRTVIVVDFSWTSSRIHACLLAEVLAGLDRMNESPAPLLVSVGESRFKPRVTLSPGQDFSILAGGDLSALTAECATPSPGREHMSLGEMMLGSFAAIRTLDALSSQFTSRDIPVRVFWLAETFDFFGVWQSSGRIEDVSDSAMTFFPIIFGKRDGAASRAPSHWQLRGAGALAQATGGFVTAVAGDRGDSLEGPVTANGATPAKAKRLTIKGICPNAPITWERQFAVTREGTAKAPLPPSAPKLERFVVPSNRIGLQFGCGEPAKERLLGLTFPPELAESPTGWMDVYLDYPNESGLARQRVAVVRGQHLEGPLCVPMIHARDGVRFRVIVRDRNSGWTGAVDGVLVSKQSGK